MSWFDIVKVLSSKTGYAQLDFDNIAEEDEDNCKKRFQELCNKLEKATKEIERKLSDKNAIMHSPTDSGISIRFESGDDLQSYVESGFLYNPDIPEEVYCKALEMLDRNMNDLETIGDYIVNTHIKSYQKSSFVDSRRVYITDKKYDDVVVLGYHINIMPIESNELLRNLIVQDLDEALK